MGKEHDVPRFGPGQWVTIRDSGAHVKIESWSAIAAAYRVQSRKSGLQFANEAELAELCEHPEVHRGKHWNRCPAPRCGAPLTPELATCPRCHAPTCLCGRCQCPSKSAPRGKTVPKKPAKKAR